MNCATSCINVAVGGHDCFTNRHLVFIFSACPNAGQSCGWEFYNSGSPNSHTLVGALVGGPDQNGVYTDTRQNELGNSVMIEYNAGFQSVLAGIQTLCVD